MRNDHSEMFKVLSARNRVKIIEHLKSRGSLCAKNISEELGISPAALSQHLKVLRYVGLVRNERKGYWIHYTLDEEALENCRFILNEVCSCACKKTKRIKEHELKKSNLEFLLEYEEELKQELTNVQKKISQIRDQKL